MHAATESVIAAAPPAGDRASSGLGAARREGVR